MAANLGEMAGLAWVSPPQDSRTGGTDMPLFAIVTAVGAIGFEQIVQWRYGPMGIVAFLLLSFGIKARSAATALFGGVILLLLLA
ncbi:hypothetical protein [Streptomyces sp. NPDC050560]|uniref:hypothetical protein n=1 Tax=Streptomyces sp. NPDC050560 TaxID=3365630 RepID=UPI0037BDF47A